MPRPSSRHVLILALPLALSACGDDDLAPSFTGAWAGKVTFTHDGFDTSGDVALTITSPKKNELLLTSLCPDGSGPTATARSTSAFDVAPRTCPAAATPTCAGVVTTITGGDGKIDGTTLTVTVSGSIEGCGTKSPYSRVFAGTRGGPGAADAGDTSG